MFGKLHQKNPILNVIVHKYIEKGFFIYFFAYSTLQSIGFIPLLIRKLFVFENGLLPKNPLYAENGDGWADSIT